MVSIAVATFFLFHQGATHSLVGRDVGRHSALRATIAREGGLHDLDVLGVRLVGPTIGANDLGDGAGSNEGREEDSDGTHFDGLVVERLRLERP